MAVTLDQAIAIAKSYENSVGALIPEVKYGPLSDNDGRVFEFRGDRVISPLETGPSNILAIREESGQVETGSRPTWCLDDDHVVLDFDGNVIRGREQVRREYQEQEAQQAALDAMENDDEPGEPVPVEHPYI
ncbi:hypothetical protein [Corynebacterium pelargi]|uniref:Uncharacterized protein n=1 Tax=Corynebacterium pelargi TaxID=1471400 RepID=A0A410W6S7_9CORY|nr:hypothetical protein [Corynebacterium pelargi]QAU51739.1 hypothetical protein CPELA_02210 [Corynebacterium pelargi]GGG80886.1 hypothetical protein GCM10007338_19350 [Corynebacterium pelargi]